MRQAPNAYRIRWVIFALVLVVKLPSPEYRAETVCCPGVRVLMGKAACPLGFSATGVPALGPSMRNWTVPVRVPAPSATAVTVAVKTTVVPLAAGEPLLVSKF